MNETVLQEKIMEVIEGFFESNKIWTLVKIPFFIFTFAGGSSLFGINDRALAIVAFSVLGVLFIGWFILMVLLVECSRRRSVRKYIAKLEETNLELKQLQERAELYAKSLTEAQRRDPDRFEIEQWKESMWIKPNGDTKIVREMILVAGDRPLDLVSATLSANSPTDSRQVKFNAIWLTQDGHESVPIHWTDEWSDDKKTMRVFLHYRETVKPQSRLQFRLTWDWPEYSKKLIDGKNETMEYSFMRRCRRLDYEVFFSQDCLVNDQLKFRPLGGVTLTEPQRQNDGSLRFSFGIAELQPGTIVGFEAGIIPQ